MRVLAARMHEASVALARGMADGSRQATQFVVAPGHVAENFEAVVEAFPRFWMVDKFGEAGQIAAATLIPSSGSGSGSGLG